MWIRKRKCFRVDGCCWWSNGVLWYCVGAWRVSGGAKLGMKICGTNLVFVFFYILCMLGGEWGNGGWWHWRCEEARRRERERRGRRERERQGRQHSVSVGWHRMEYDLGVQKIVVWGQQLNTWSTIEHGTHLQHKSNNQADTCSKRCSWHSQTESGTQTQIMFTQSSIEGLILTSRSSPRGWYWAPLTFAIRLFLHSPFLLSVLGWVIVLAGKSDEDDGAMKYGES